MLAKIQLSCHLVEINQATWQNYVTFEMDDQDETFFLNELQNEI
jgi:hypothetical protein